MRRTRRVLGKRPKPLQCEYFVNAKGNVVWTNASIGNRKVRWRNWRKATAKEVERFKGSSR